MSTLARPPFEIAYDFVRDAPSRAAGRPEEGTLVVLHGFGLHRGLVRGLTEALAEGARLRATLTVDLRGHGETRCHDTDPDLRAFRYEAMRDDVLALLELHEIRDAQLVGHSMGGQIALLAALAAPERVRSLAVLAGGPCRAITDPRERESWERAADFFERADPDALARALARAAPVDARAHPALAPDALYAGARGHDLARIIRGGFFSIESNEAACRGLRVPTLALAGARDTTWLGPTRQLARLVPGSLLVEIEGAGHLVHLEAPAACRDAIARFWSAPRKERNPERPEREERETRRAREETS